MLINRPVTRWMECRRKSDKAEGLWRIHDKLYDLTDFIQRHPGGREWLEITKVNVQNFNSIFVNIALLSGHRYHRIVRTSSSSTHR